MNEIERAIEHYNYGVSHDIFSEPVTTYAKMAAAALREQAEREKGCEHCKVLTAEHCTGFLLPSADPDCEADMVTISHCPMCGKRLEVEHEN